MESLCLTEELKVAINTKTKPIGSLGMLESIALQAGLIQKTVRPFISAPHVVVFAADHGIAAKRLVNPYPQEVTAQMVLNFLRGGAAINVFCKQNQISLKVVDAGVKADFSGLYDQTLINASVAKGTNDYSSGDAMSEEEALFAIAMGKHIVKQIVLTEKCNLIAFGEMGISNTSSASLIMSAVLGQPIEDCVGKGTGVSDEGLATKVETLKKVFDFHQLRNFEKYPIPLLTKIGGFEIAQMVGAYLQAYEEDMIIVVDGFISTASLLLASKINPLILENCMYAHASSEKGHIMLLNHLRGMPLLNLGLRLGEGTGAALAIPLIQSAVNFLNEMASFKSASISDKII
jgi:nicotinate-nucleotide--dimethylbenzimidazole phosphoribosyltransferase